MRISEQTVLSKCKDVVWREVDREGILLNLEDGFYYGINSVGLALWKAIDGKRRLGEIVSCLCQEYRVPEGKALPDASRWASHLIRRRLLMAAG